MASAVMPLTATSHAASTAIPSSSLAGSPPRPALNSTSCIEPVTTRASVIHKIRHASETYGRTYVLQGARARWRLATGVVAILAAFFTFGACGDDEVAEAPTAAASSLGQWAAQFCDASQAFQDTASSLPPSNSLPLDQRKTQAAANIATTTQAVDKAITAIKALRPPGEVAAYQSANITQLEAIRAAYQKALPVIQGATTTTAIESANADVAASVASAQAATAEEGKRLSPQAAAAIRGVTRCGAVKQ